MPTMLLIAAVIAVADGNPFFWQYRIGKDGVTFPCLKFRTMVRDADSRLKAHLAAHPEARRQWESHAKLDRDPRITRIGLFLRRTSLDELPQLFNVIAGHMSIVGPRPVPASELVLYGNTRRDYLAVRPGMTGMWQVFGRGQKITYSRRVAMDRFYVRTMSLQQDLRLIGLTVGVVLRRTGQ